MVGRRTQGGARDGHRAASLRGQSEVLSVVLLLGITITGTGLIVMYGSSALDDSQQAAEIDSAAHIMTQFDSKASLVGIGASQTQSMPLDVDTPLRVENQSGWMRVTVNPLEGADASLWCGNPPCTVMDQRLGAVMYENGDTVIAYQGGGVWKQTANGTTMVSPPEVHYRGSTLTLPLVVVSGQGPLSDRAVIQQNGTSTPKYPLATDRKSNPLQKVRVNLTVHSTYYQAWGRFFEERTGGTVVYDHTNQTAQLTLITPPNVPDVTQGVAATSSQALTIKGGGGSLTFTDSYNSSTGPYSASQTESGTIRTLGGVEMSGDAEIHGDLVSGGGAVEIKSDDTRVKGNVSYAGSFSQKGGATVTGWVANNGSVPKIDPVGGMVTAKNASIHDANNNSETTTIDGATLNHTKCRAGSGCTLTAGTYYLDQLTLDNGEHLTFDLSAGTIDIAVSGPITIDDGNITVTHPENARVNIYMDASTFTMDNHANVSVPNQTAGSFRVYGPPGVDAAFSKSHFVGVLYAPNSDSQHGSISVTTHAEVFGALVGGETTMRSGGTVHYDMALRHAKTLPQNYEMAPPVTYMHLTVNRVNVTSR